MALEQKEFVLYKLKMIDESVVYVGYTGRGALNRFKEHSNDKYWINKITEIEECKMKDQGNATIAEKTLINDLMPLFNIEDKYPGTEIEYVPQAYKNFYHKSYVFNGEPTECVPKTDDGFMLVNVIDCLGHEIGIYYNEYLDMYCSLENIFKLLKISNSKKHQLLEQCSDDSVILNKYSMKKKSMIKTKNCYLANFYGIRDLIDVSNVNDYTKEELINVLENAFMNGNLSFKLDDAEKEASVRDMMSAEFDKHKELYYLFDRYAKRKLAYNIVVNTNDDNYKKTTKQVINKHIASNQEFILRYPILADSLDIFCKINDLCIEYETSFKNVLKDFENYLWKKKIDYWKRIKHIEKELGFKTRPYIIISKDEMLRTEFNEYYEMKLEEIL